MGKVRIGHLMTGAALALIAAAPAAVSARPRVESVVPLPPSLNGEPSLRHREAPPPVPPPPQQRRQAPAAKPPAPPAHADVPAAKPPSAAEKQPSAEVGRFDIKGALNRLLSDGDEQITERLRALVGKMKAAKGHDQDDERKAIIAFYAARNYAPLWIANGALTDQAKAAITRLKNADADGLNATDYPTPDFGASRDAAALAKADIAFTQSVMTFARHLEAGRIAPRRVFAQVKYDDHTPEPAAILKTIADARDIDAAFDGFNPPHQGFRLLKRKLAELRGTEGGDAAARAPRISGGNLIKLGVHDPRVPLLRERLGVRTQDPNDTVYDRALFNAVRTFQHSHGLRPDGIVGSNVIAAINGPKTLTRGQKIERVEANMERWRWLPRRLGKVYVVVNIPDYSLNLVRDDQVAWHTKIVAGKPQTPTPLTSATMNQVTINPSWYVPQSIIQNELLPQYEADPNIFDRMGLEVRRGPDGNINVVQPPGAANALGRIKFSFPNKFQVYLHDTPEKRLFSYGRRAFSHGCMRVENPTKFGEMILAMSMKGPTPDAQQIYAMFGQDQRVFKLAERPMVHLTYQTAFVDGAGALQFRDDVYGFDKRMHDILHSDERRIADVAPPPDPKRDLETLKSNQEILRRVERREALNPFRFFERLFR